MVVVVVLFSCCKMRKRGQKGGLRGGAPDCSIYLSNPSIHHHEVDCSRLFVIFLFVAVIVSIVVHVLVVFVFKLLLLFLGKHLFTIGIFSLQI